MEKQLATAAYWIGIFCVAAAIILRGLALEGFSAMSTALEGKADPISFRTFLNGAILFFIMAIASSVIAWAKEGKA